MERRERKDLSLTGKEERERGGRTRTPRCRVLHPAVASPPVGCIFRPWYVQVSIGVKVYLLQDPNNHKSFQAMNRVSPGFSLFLSLKMKF